MGEFGGKPTLIIHIVYFAQIDAEILQGLVRIAEQQFGYALYNLLTRRISAPLSRGSGVRVRIATRLDCVVSDKAVDVVLAVILGPQLQADEHKRKVALARIEDWRERRDPRVRRIPVATEQSRAHEGQLCRLIVAKDAQPAPETLDAIILEVTRVLSTASGASTRLFISPAKGDLAATGAPPSAFDLVQGQTTAERPSSTVSLRAGESRDEQIDAQACKGGFVAVRGASYNSRAWCIRELLKAKRLPLPVLIVEALTSGEDRSAAYSGNSRWYGATVLPTPRRSLFDRQCSSQCAACCLSPRPRASPPPRSRAPIRLRRRAHQLPTWSHCAARAKECSSQSTRYPACPILWETPGLDLRGTQLHIRER